jgi:hypothetical protein
MRPLAFALLVAAFPAAAQEVDLLKGSAVVPPAPRTLPRTPDGQLVLSPEVCASLARLLPSGGDYQPGVDARGQAVAPADLPAVSRPKIEEFPIEVTAPIGGAASGTQQLLRLGFVTLRGNRAFFNGEPLSDPEQGQLESACRNQRR